LNRVFNSQLYLPRIAVIEDVKELSPDTKLFRVVFKEPAPQLSRENEFLPGQFVQVWTSGVGEVPISICSSPLDEGFIELAVRRTGMVTSALHRLKPGDEIGIRGPYGNHFPVENGQFRHLLFVGGGCGLAPLRSLIRYMIQRPDKSRRLTILYGARTTANILFKDELNAWSQSGELELNLSVDCGPADPGCNVGVVTTLFKKFDRLRDTMAFVCGPAMMLHYTVKELLDLGLKDEDVILSLERYMKCGVGKCGHCYIKDKYVCTDGPVFSYRQLKEMKAEI
jgi:NAD(P)H-flavin reductase